MAGYKTHYRDSGSSDAHAYLWPPLQRLIASRSWPERRAFDLGCGNGATMAMLAARGFAVTGIDSSESGVEQAQRACGADSAALASVYDISPRATAASRWS